MNFKKKFNKFQEKFDVSPFFSAFVRYFKIKTNCYGHFSSPLITRYFCVHHPIFTLFQGKRTLCISEAPVMTGRLEL